MRATRTERARVLLTKLVPPLLEALAKAGDADEAFFAFEDFLSRLPAGVQVFSLLLNNLEIFDVLIRIMTISPYHACASDSWRLHFRWDGVRAIGLSPTGRATVAALNLNRAVAQAIRHEEILRDRHPPQGHI
jgi:hypothetical protein